MTPPRAATPAGRRASGGSPSRAPREEIRITAKSQSAMAGAARAAVRASAAAASSPSPRAGGRTATATPRRASGPGARPGARPSAPGRSALPRRVSGPLSGRIASAAAAVALPQRNPVPLPAPRRRPTPVTRPSRRDLPGGARALAWLRGLPDHRLLDRLIGGRVWIVLIGTLLVGIVTMQLSLLKLNAGIGRAVERGSQLEQRNATLRATISRLSDSERVVAAATQMGYVVPPQGSPRYLRASAGDARAALSVMRMPQSPTTATTLAATDTAATTTADPNAAATIADPTAATDTTTDVTTTSTTSTTTTATTGTAGTATGTTAPVAPATTSTGAAGTTSAGATAGTTAAAGGATAPTGSTG